MKPMTKLLSFQEQIQKDLGVDYLPSSSLSTFQINIGRWCNQACKHCHVDASPNRKELMNRETMDLCLDTIARNPEFKVVDITGGAPEGNPLFRYLVTSARDLDRHVIDRCNLTILEEPGFEYLYDFLAANKVEIISSLPCYTAKETNKQRGDGVFEKSITALQKLNSIGYGKEPDLKLSLVYNPTGLSLAGNQEELEKDFKTTLGEEYGVVFDHLICMNNMPINRFQHSLERAGRLEEYQNLLIQAYNPRTLDGLMCRHQVSVDYEGNLYDCDFNQMLGIKSSPISHIRDFDSSIFRHREIQLGEHCYGCTAGAGSSCGGKIVATV
jgi:radical SAM/Cys-rich protein